MPVNSMLLLPTVMVMDAAAVGPELVEEMEGV